MNKKQDILSVLEEDLKYRKKDILKYKDLDLIKIKEIVPVKSYNCNYTTIIEGYSKNYLLNTILTKNVIIDFYKKFPFLEELDMSNLLIAGGAVSMFYSPKKEYDDIDVFVYGLSEKEATKRIEKFLTELRVNDNKIYNKKYNKDKEYRQDTIIEKTKYTIRTLTIDNIKIQIIFRLYRTKSEILHGFDLPSSAIGFDGEHIYMTKLSKFCTRRSVNVVDNNRRSTSYEYRLKKYFNRGWDIILPEFDMNKFYTEYINIMLKNNMIILIDLPFMKISSYKIRGNKFMGCEILNINYSSDYKSLGNLTYLSSTVKRKNCINLLKENYNDIVIHSSNIKDIFYPKNI